MKAARFLPLAAAAMLCGCFNTSSYTPVLTSITTTFVSGGVAGLPTGATQAQLNGKFFQPGTAAFWDGNAVPTTFVSDNAVQLTLTPAQTAVAGVHQVTAINDDSFLSNSIPATIVDATLTTSGVSPAQIAPGSVATDVTVTGTGFRPDTRLLWNLTDLPHTFVNSTTLTASVPASLLAFPGQGIIQVSNCQLQPNIVCLDQTLPITLNVGASTIRTIQTAASTAVWDATRGLLYVAGGALNGPGAITPLDPATGGLGTAVATTGTPQLAMSDQDLFLYSAPAQGPALRYALPGLTNPTQVSSGAERIAAAPGAPTTVAVTNGVQVIIVDGTTPRPNKSTAEFAGLVWGADTGTLYVTDPFTGVDLVHVDANGVASATTIRGSSPGDGPLGFDRVAGLLFTNLGKVFDAAGGSQAPFSLPASCVGTLDGALGVAFFACNEEKQGETIGLTIHAYDLATRQPRGEVLLSGANASSPFAPGPGAIVRFGDNGLAVPAFNSVYLYTGAFVH